MGTPCKKRVKGGGYCHLHLDMMAERIKEEARRKADEERKLAAKADEEMGCTCKGSYHCIEGNCGCHQSGIDCTSKCSCVNCKNGKQLARKQREEEERRRKEEDSEEITAKIEKDEKNTKLVEKYGGKFDSWNKIEVKDHQNSCLREDFHKQEWLEGVLQNEDMYDMFKKFGWDDTDKWKYAPISGCIMNDSKLYGEMMWFRTVVAIYGFFQGDCVSQPEIWKKYVFHINTEGDGVCSEAWLRDTFEAGLRDKLEKVTEKTKTDDKAWDNVVKTLELNRTISYSMDKATNKRHPLAELFKDGDKGKVLTACHHAVLCESMMGANHYKCARPCHLRYGTHLSNRKDETLAHDPQWIGYMKKTQECFAGGAKMEGVDSPLSKAPSIQSLEDLCTKLESFAIDFGSKEDKKVVHKLYVRITEEPKKCQATIGDICDMLKLVKLEEDEEEAIERLRGKDATNFENCNCTQGCSYKCKCKKDGKYCGSDCTCGPQCMNCENKPKEKKEDGEGKGKGKTNNVSDQDQDSNTHNTRSNPCHDFVDPNDVKNSLTNYKIVFKFFSHDKKNVESWLQQDFHDQDWLEGVLQNKEMYDMFKDMQWEKQSHISEKKSESTWSFTPISGCIMSNDVNKETHQKMMWFRTVVAIYGFFKSGCVSQPEIWKKYVFRINTEGDGVCSEAWLGKFEQNLLTILKDKLKEFAKKNEDLKEVVTRWLIKFEEGCGGELKEVTSDFGNIVWNIVVKTLELNRTISYSMDKAKTRHPLAELFKDGDKGKVLTVCHDVLCESMMGANYHKCARPCHLRYGPQALQENHEDLARDPQWIGYMKKTQECFVGGAKMEGVDSPLSSKFHRECHFGLFSCYDSPSIQSIGDLCAKLESFAGSKEDKKALHKLYERIAEEPKKCQATIGAICDMLKLVKLEGDEEEAIERLRNKDREMRTQQRGEENVMVDPVKEE